MDIYYADGYLKRICEDSAFATNRIGKIAATRLTTRLAELSGASSVTELWGGNPHPLKGQRHGQFALNLHAGQRLVFSAHPATPAGSQMNWSSVTAICICFIGDYHD